MASDQSCLKIIHFKQAEKNLLVLKTKKTVWPKARRGFIH